MDRRVQLAHELALKENYKPISNFLKQYWPPRNLRKVEFIDGQRVQLY